MRIAIVAVAFCLSGLSARPTPISAAEPLERAALRIFAEEAPNAEKIVSAARPLSVKVHSPPEDVGGLLALLNDPPKQVKSLEVELVPKPEPKKGVLTRPGLRLAPDADTVPVSKIGPKELSSIDGLSAEHKALLETPEKDVLKELKKAPPVNAKDVPEARQGPPVRHEPIPVYEPDVEAHKAADAYEQLAQATKAAKEEKALALAQAKAQDEARVLEKARLKDETSAKKAAEAAEKKAQALAQAQAQEEARALAKAQEDARALVKARTKEAQKAQRLSESGVQPKSDKRNSIMAWIRKTTGGLIGL